MWYQNSLELQLCKKPLKIWTNFTGVCKLPIMHTTVPARTQVILSICQSLRRVKLYLFKTYILAIHCSHFHSLPWMANQLVLFVPSVVCRQQKAASSCQYINLLPSRKDWKRFFMLDFHYNIYVYIVCLFFEYIMILYILYCTYVCTGSIIIYYFFNISTFLSILHFVARYFTFIFSHCLGLTWKDIF